MTKPYCIVCNRHKAVVYFGILDVCQSCFNMLMKRKIQIAHEKMLEAKSK